MSQHGSPHGSPSPHRPAPRRPGRLLALLAAALLGALLTTGLDRTAAHEQCGEEVERADLAAAPHVPLRVATFNVHSLRDAAGAPALERALATLEGFDLVGLQEVRGAPFGPGQADELGDALGLARLFAASERRWWHGHLGNAALLDRPVTAWRATPLPNTRGKAYRNVLLLDVPLGDASLKVLVTHLDTQDDRARQLDLVLERFEALATPAVLLGDLNTPPDDPVLRTWLDETDARDAHADDALPADRVDWILVRGLDVLAAGVRDLGASDHPCLWAEVDVAPTVGLVHERDPGPGPAERSLASKGRRSVAPRAERRSGAADEARSTDAGGPCVLTGRVVDDVGAPIEGFTLLLEGPRHVLRKLPEARGSFRITGLSSGTWSVTAIASPHSISEPVPVQLREEAEAEVELVLPRAGRLEGVVLGAGGRPVAGEIRGRIVSPVLELDTSRYRPLAATREDGTFSIEVRPGTAHMFATAEGHAPSEVILHSVASGEVALGIVLQLRRAGRLEVELLDDRGRPAAGREIDVWEPRSLYRGREETDASGRARFEGLPPGTFSVWLEVRVQENGVKSWDTLCSAEVVLQEGQSERVTLRIPASEELEGTLRIRGIEAVPRPMVTLSQVEGERSASALQRQDGAFDVTVPTAGEYDLRLVSFGSGFLYGRRIVVPEHSPWSLELVVATGTLTGRVDDASGLPAADVVVEARLVVPEGAPGGGPGRESGVYWARTRPDGWFELLVPAGRHRVRAVELDDPLVSTVLEDVAVEPGATVVGADLELRARDGS